MDPGESNILLENLIFWRVIEFIDYHIHFEDPRLLHYIHLIAELLRMGEITGTLPKITADLILEVEGHLETYKYGHSVITYTVLFGCE